MRQESAHPKLRVLVADDRRDDVLMTTMLLQDAGHQPLGVESGVAAMEALPGFNPDAVVLDIGMPDLSGWDIARALRARYGRKVLLVAVTAYGGRSDKALSKVAGFDHHFVKPADPRKLLAALEQFAAARLADGDADRP